MNPEVLRDLLDRHTGIAVTGDPHDVIAELSGVGLGHSGILPTRPQGKPSQMSPAGAADPTTGPRSPQVASAGVVYDQPGSWRVVRWKTVTALILFQTTKY